MINKLKNYCGGIAVIFNVLILYPVTYHTILLSILLINYLI